MEATSSWLSALTLTAAAAFGGVRWSFHCCQINPFKMIASNYTDAKIREYKGKKHYELNPHVFALVSESAAHCALWPSSSRARRCRCGWAGT